MAAEMTAFLAALVEDLPCPRFNAPTATSLLGPPFTRQHWWRAAAAAGAPVCARRDASCDADSRDVVLLDGTPSTVADADGVAAAGPCLRALQASARSGFAERTAACVGSPLAPRLDARRPLLRERCAWILLWGSRADPPIAAVEASLRRSGADLAVVDRGARCQRPWSPTAESLLHIEGRAIDLGAVTAGLPSPSERLFGDRGSLPRRDASSLWADTTDAFVVNRPAAMAPNNSKPLQIRAIARQGFRVPETLVTTEPDAVRAFIAHHGEVIYKSVSGHRSIVQRLAPSQLHALDDITTCSTQFQRYIEGDDVRVPPMRVPRAPRPAATATTTAIPPAGACRRRSWSSTKPWHRASPR